MSKFRKKPVTIEAVQLTWANWDEMCDHANVGPGEDEPHGVYIDSEGNPHDKPIDESCTLGLLIPTLEGVMLANEYDWVIRGVQGELYPCKPDIFEATYEPVE